MSLEKEKLVSDILPNELTFICKMCHIAANKRMSQGVECGDKNITGQYCEKIERLRRALVLQSAELEVSRKYTDIFIKAMGGRTIFRKQELMVFFDNYSPKTTPSLNEFMDFCRTRGIEILE